VEQRHYIVLGKFIVKRRVVTDQLDVLNSSDKLSSFRTNCYNAGFDLVCPVLSHSLSQQLKNIGVVSAGQAAVRGHYDIKSGFNRSFFKQRLALDLPDLVQPSKQFIG